MEGAPLCTVEIYRLIDDKEQIWQAIEACQPTRVGAPLDFIPFGQTEADSGPMSTGQSEMKMPDASAEVDRSPVRGSKAADRRCWRVQ